MALAHELTSPTSHKGCANDTPSHRHSSAQLIQTDPSWLNGNGALHPISRTDVLAALSTSGLRDLPQNALATEARQLRLEVRQLLSLGTPQPDERPVLPFRFRHSHQIVRYAPNPGLEGFLFAERRFAAQFGNDASMQLLPDYLKYCADMVRPLGWTKFFELALKDLADSPAPLEKRYHTFVSTLGIFVDMLQQLVRENDPSIWCRSLRAYHCFTSVSSLPERRRAYGSDELPDSGFSSLHTGRTPWFQECSAEDFKLLAEYGFNAIRVMGIYPRGRANRKGDAEGSPFSIQRYEVDPSLGSTDDVRRMVELANAYGLRTIFEFVPNHTAVDADFVHTHPECYIHTRTEPANPSNYHYFKHPEKGDFWIRYGAYRGVDMRHYFTDTLQLDFSNPHTRSAVIGWAVALIERYGIHGLRIDMMHNLLNSNLERCWGDELAGELPSHEFIEEFISAIKSHDPRVALIGEALGGTPAEFEQLSSVGLDLIYNLDDLPTRGGHQHSGWLTALSKRSSQDIRAAIERAEFLDWQLGSVGGVTFLGQHDRPAPWHEYGDWVWGAVFLTALKPGALCLYGGTEARFEAPCAEDGKMISFNTPRPIEWLGIRSDFGEYLHRVLREFSGLRARLGEDLVFERVEPGQRADGTSGDSQWVGFLVKARAADYSAPKALVLANLSSQASTAVIHDTKRGINAVEVTLDPCGPQGQRLVHLTPYEEINPGKNLRMSD